MAGKKEKQCLDTEGAADLPSCFSSVFEHRSPECGLEDQWCGNDGLVACEGLL